MAAKINWFSILAIGGVLIKGISEALTDGRITVDEIIEIVVSVVTRLGLETRLDTNGIAFVTNFIKEVWAMVEDGRITSDEVTALVNNLAETFQARVG